MLEAISRAFGLQSKSTLASPPSELIALFGASPSKSGVSVSWRNAMKCTTVAGCVRVIAESVASLPLHLYERTEGGGKRRADDHPLAEILAGEANDWTSSYEFRLNMQTALCLHGNAFAFINRAGDRITELVQIPSECVAVRVDRQTMEPRYEVHGLDGIRTYERGDILHLRGIGHEPHVGDSPIMLAKEAIALSLAMEEHAARLFGSGARPAGVFKYPKALGTEALKRLRSQFSQAHEGLANAGRTLILEDGMEWEQAQFSSVDLQFNEMRRHQIAEIARVFRVPLHLLQELERTTHANAESNGAQFLSLTLLPWLTCWESGVRRSLLTLEERRTYYAEFTVDGLARADLAARFTAYSAAITNGILSPNEVRSLENRPPYPGGDQYRLPLNTEGAAPSEGAA